MYSSSSPSARASKRYHDFLELDFPRKALTIEPILDFNLEKFTDWIYPLHDSGDLQFVWIGFNSKTRFVKLPELSEVKVSKLIDSLKEYGVEVRGKELRNIIL